MKQEETVTNHKERMVRELPYKPWLSGLKEERDIAKKLCYQYNHCNPNNTSKKQKILKKLLGKISKTVIIEPNFYCDYGYNIELEGNFYSNHNLVILDVAKVKIGNNVLFGPNCSIITAGHPIHPKSRESGYEYGIGVTIKDGVWLGSNVVVNPGVTIGENSIIASGSVVTKDVEPNSIYGGVPSKKIRNITEDDRKYYFKDRVFDIKDY